MKLILIRHGETREGRRGILLGRLPGTLTVQGKRFAERVGRTLATFPNPPKLVITSDLRRAQNTASIISRIVHTPLKVDPLLRERSGGNAEGKTPRQIDWRKYEEKTLVSRRHRGGESFCDVKKRAAAFLRKIRKEKQTPIVVISHAVVLSMILSDLLKWSYAKALKFDFRDKAILVDTKKAGMVEIPLKSSISQAITELFTNNPVAETKEKLVIVGAKRRSKL